MFSLVPKNSKFLYSKGFSCHENMELDLERHRTLKVSIWVLRDDISISQTGICCNDAAIFFIFQVGAKDSKFFSCKSP